MKTDRIMWGIVLLFIGSVLLLENFNIINFYWRSIWRFWPIFLIIAGVNILFNKNKSQVGGIVSIAVLLFTLVLLFVKGQQAPAQKDKWIGARIQDDINAEQRYEELNFAEPYHDSAAKRTVLNISGGGTSFELKGGTDSLITAYVQKKAGIFSLQNELKDSVNTLIFKMKGKSGWSVGDGGNDVELRLNKKPAWEIHMNMGAGEVDFDFSEYKVRSFSFDGGAAALDIKFSSLLPVTDVNIKTGVANVKLNVPTGAGCKIKTKTGLSAKDFAGFNKLNDGTYETSGYNTSANKILINLDGGLSNFEVRRY